MEVGSDPGASQQATKAMAKPETVYRTPESWGEYIYYQSKEAAAPLIKEMRQHEEAQYGDPERISADDLEPLSLRDDGRYEDEGDWGDGFRVQNVQVVSLMPEDDGTMTVVAIESEQRYRDGSRMVTHRVMP